MSFRVRSRRASAHVVTMETSLDALRARSAVSLLDADPELGDGIARPQYDDARRRSIARVMNIETPRWDPQNIVTAAGRGWLGIFVVDGVLFRRVKIGGRSACEILGQGDIFRPWDEDGPYEPLAVTVDWLTLDRVRLAVLDDKFAARIARWPSISAALIQRITRRARQLALLQAVTHLRRTHSSLLLMFWLLAQRWGTVVPEGVLVRLGLTHQMLATAVGCQRPSATLALQKLARNGLLIRRSPERWLLTTAAIELLRDPGSLARLQ